MDGRGGTTRRRMLSRGRSRSSQITQRFSSRSPKLWTGRDGRKKRKKRTARPRPWAPTRKVIPREQRIKRRSLESGVNSERLSFSNGQSDRQNRRRLANHI